MTLKFGARFRRYDASRSPSTALQFWTVTHKLRHRLEPYQITELPRPFRTLSWSQLRFWALLLDEDDAGIATWVGADPDAEIPTPEEWFGKVKT